MRACKNPKNRRVIASVRPPDGRGLCDKAPQKSLTISPRQAELAVRRSGHGYKGNHAAASTAFSPLREARKPPRRTPMRLALYQPDIPQNTGAMLRLAACFGVTRRCHPAGRLPLRRQADARAPASTTSTSVEIVRAQRLGRLSRVAERDAGPAAAADHQGRPRLHRLRLRAAATPSWSAARAAGVPPRSPRPPTRGWSSRCGHGLRSAQRRHGRGDRDRPRRCGN